MKKFALGFCTIVTSLNVSVADIRPGFYGGANAALTSMAVKGHTGAEDPFAVGDPTVIYRESVEMSNKRLGGGVFVGYGYLCGCMYFAGEFAYKFNNSMTKKVDSLQGLPISLKVTNKHLFNGAILIGPKVTPSTVVYGRFGLSWTRPKLHAFVFDTSLDKDKGHGAFEVGFGMETSIDRNWNLRLQWTMDIGDKMKQDNNITGSRNNFGPNDRRVKVTRFRTSAIQAGILYRV